MIGSNGYLGVISAKKFYRMSLSGSEYDKSYYNKYKRIYSAYERFDEAKITFTDDYFSRAENKSRAVSNVINNSCGNKKIMSK